MKNPELYSTESIKRRSTVHHILASYMARNEKVIELVHGHDRLSQITNPIDLLDCLLHEFSDTNTFTQLSEAAEIHLSTLSEVEKIELLNKATNF